MTTILFSDVKNQIKDLVTSYSTSSIDLGNIDRAANRAIEVVQRRLGLPSDKKIQSLYFYEDSLFYDCNDAFNELLSIRYNTSANSTVIDQDPNVPRMKWGIFKDTEILTSTGSYPGMNQAAFTTINGKNQIVLHGRNMRGSSIVNSLSSTSGLSYSTDVTSITQDTDIYKYSNGSVKFSLNTSLSSSYVSFAGLWDISKLINLNSAYRLYVNFPSGTTGYFSNVEIRLQSSTGNYYSMTTTLQSDGTAWNSGTWSLLAWNLSSATKTGTPDPKSIKNIYIYFNHSGSFTTTTDLRINYFYQITPDYLDVIYYSAIKGTDTTGVTSKVILTEDSDILAFGSYAPDLIYPIALQGAKILSPQILADPNFRAIYKDDYEETMKLFGRTYPRQRSSSFGKTNIGRF